MHIHTQPSKMASASYDGAPLVTPTPAKAIALLYEMYLMRLSPNKVTCVPFAIYLSASAQAAKIRGTKNQEVIVHCKGCVNVEGDLRVSLES